MQSQQGNTETRNKIHGGDKLPKPFSKRSVSGDHRLILMCVHNTLRMEALKVKL